VWSCWRVTTYRTNMLPPSSRLKYAGWETGQFHNLHCITTHTITLWKKESMKN
jgi:hypothetical protein